MKSLLRRFYFLILILIVYRVGTYIPLPGIDSELLSQLVKEKGASILGMFNMFTGGALGRMSIFALNIMPYITSSIVIQLFTVLSPQLALLKKEGDLGRQKMGQYTRYLTIFLALFQGYGLAVGLENMTVSGSLHVVSSPGWIFRLTATMCLMGGTVLIMWLAEQITAKGIGNGSSMIIFSGIVAGLPSALAALFDLGRSGAVSGGFMFIMLMICVVMVCFVVFMEMAQRKLLINYPKRQIGRKIYGGDSTHMPLKLNTAGVIGPIFASSLLLFPSTLIGFMGGVEKVDSWQYIVMTNLGHGKILYLTLYVSLIIFFSFFYTAVVFNPEETAENLRKAGAVVTGRRPGANTADYINYVLIRITTVGALYVAAICVIPEILISKYAVPFYLGGTSLLIIVSVVIDLFQQIQTNLLSDRYGNYMKKYSALGKN